jgi:hypothetical protein
VEIKGINYSLRIAFAWKLLAELHRRYPTRFHAIETHPGGGMYDCLSLYDNTDVHYASFNMAGRFHVFQRFDNKKPGEPLDIWPLMVEQDTKDVLDKVSHQLGLKIPATLPSSTPETVVYRFIAAFLVQSCLEPPCWQARNGVFDTSGYGGGLSQAFTHFPVAASRADIGLGFNYNNKKAYKFWFLTRDDEPLLCLETNGTVWRRDGASFSLPELYSKHHRVNLLLSTVANDLLP